MQGQQIFLGMDAFLSQSLYQMTGAFLPMFKKPDRF